MVSSCKKPFVANRFRAGSMPAFFLAWRDRGGCIGGGGLRSFADRFFPPITLRKRARILSAGIEYRHGALTVCAG